ncbi:MAG: P-loop NTPase, partial [Candidatus Sumerlaeota bacterium]
MTEQKKSPPSACENCDKSNCSAESPMPGETDEQFLERRMRMSRMCRIGKKILVMSGKGGVGKSTMAVNLATELMLSGKQVGLLDIDIHGPSVPTLLGIEDAGLMADGDDLVPFELGSMKVLSIGFMLRGRDDAVIWRGPRKAGVISQFLGRTTWGDLDYLIVDSPPGTGDELLAICQMMDRV